MKYRVACIGAGYFAKFHIAAWKRIPEVELMTICDHDIIAARSLADRYQVPSACSDFHEILDDSSIDIVDIITPPDSHLSIVRDVARSGKTIICQKPLAPTYAEAKTIVEITEAAGAGFMVHENFRFQPWYRKIKELLKNEIIGERIFSLTLRMRMGDGWAPDAYLDRQPYFRKMERLLIYETGIHYIDVFRFLLGDIDRVFAKLMRLNNHIKGEDMGLVLFDFRSGAVGLLDANRYNESNYPDARFTFGETTVEGEGGTIRLYGDGKITVQHLSEKEEEIKYEINRIDFAGDCVYNTQRHFIDNLKAGQTFETNGRDYLENLRIQDAVYKSADLGRQIDL